MSTDTQQTPLVDRLFRVYAPVTVTCRGRSLTLHLRTIGGKDEAARNDFATARARRLYHLLKDPASAEYGRYLGSLDGAATSELIEQCVRLKLPLLARQVRDTAQRAEDPEPPAIPTLTEVIETEIETERLDAEVEQERAENLEATVALYRAELESMGAIVLLETARELLSDAVLNQAYAAASNAYTLYSTVYADAKYRVRYFAGPDEAEEADPNFIAQLIAQYIELDGFTQEPEQLKN